MKYGLLFGLLIAAIGAQAQTVLENNPSGLPWYQINTQHFRILYPQGFEQQGQRMANTLEHIHAKEARSLGRAPRKISVLLQSQSSVSNGFVSILPRRSEFYAMPPQDYNFLGTNDWLNLLASHEYRHVVQYQNATRGFNRLFYYIFGNQALAGMAQAAAPQWFWEGDAVATETAFTPSGRGRIPNFGLVFRTNLLEGRTFNYHKQHLRSYKHNIPNHYVLGYHMVSYLRRKTGDPNIWGKITARSWNIPFIPFAFSNAIHRETGLYVTGLYREMAASLRQDWQAEMDKLTLTSFQSITPRNSKAYTDYKYPTPLANGILVQREGIGDIEQYVLMHESGTRTLFTPGMLNDAGMLSASANVMVWTEYGYDVRWPVKNFSLIKSYDLRTGQRYVISDKHARYGGVAIAPDEKQLVAIETDDQYQHRVKILAYPSGQVLHTFPNEQNLFYAMPRWTNDGRIIALRNSREGKALVILNPQTDEEQIILPPSSENIGHPVQAGDYILFNSPASGIDNIHAVEIATGKRFQVTTTRYGAYNPALSADGKTLYYNDQTRDGLDVVKVPFDPTQWQVQEVKREPLTFFQHLVKQEGSPNLFDSIPQQTLPATRYRKAKGMINPYTWGLYVQSDLSRADIGITSQDILSTTALSAGYTIDLNERTGYWRAGLSYQGLLPILDVNFTQGKRKVEEGDGYGLTEWRIARNGDTTKTYTNQTVTLEWKEQNVEAGLRIPFNFTQSRFYRRASIGNYVGYTHVTDFSNGVNRERYVPAIIRYDTVTVQGQQRARTSVMSLYPFLDYVGNNDLVYNRFVASFYNLQKMSRRDIYSKWGQAFYLNYYSTPYGGNLKGGLFSFLGYLYLPGFFKHHSINGYWAYQSTPEVTSVESDYLFRNHIPLPRGQSVNRFRKFYSMSVNYALPLWYPDIALGPVLNIQRVRLNMFLDYGFGQQRFFDNIDKSYVSVGGEMKFDINIMRFLPRLDVGFRYAYGLQPSVTKFEVLIGTFNL